MWLYAVFWLLPLAWSSLQWPALAWWPSALALAPLAGLALGSRNAPGTGAPPDTDASGDLSSANVPPRESSRDF
jgi:hypothetical protein